MNRILPLACMATLACAAQADYVPERADYSFRSETVTTCEDGDCVADSIIVYATDARQHTTVMSTWAWPLNTAQWNGIGEVSEEDINQDGYPDLMVCNGPVNAFGNHTYTAWLWNQATHAFVLVPNFDEINAPSFVKTDDAKLVVGTYRLDNEVETTTYRWRGDTLERVSTERSTIDELTEP